MIRQEFASPLWVLWTIPVTALVMVVGTVVYTRIIGLRSFSKLSAFDFAITIAIGSVIGATVLSTASGYSVVNGLLALGSLFSVQTAIALIRRRVRSFRRTVDNTPVLLMAGSNLLDDNLQAARMTRGDVYAKLREANVLDLGEVRAVVLETTGDISVLHGPGELNPAVLTGVADVELLEPDP